MEHDDAVAPGRLPSVGTVSGLHRTPVRRGAAEPVAEVALIADLGVEGDHHVQAGSLRQVVLAAQEVLDDLGLAAGAVREQLTVAGIGAVGAGDHLAFPSGARIRLTRPRVPCGVMNKVRTGLRNEMLGRGGWCARVVTSGTVVTGDDVVVTPAPYAPAADRYLDAMTRWEEAGAPKFDRVLERHEAVLGVDTTAIDDRWLRVDLMSATLIDSGSNEQLVELAADFDRSR